MKSIVIGVIDKPYSLGDEKKGIEPQTTSRVSQYIEDKYNLFATFTIKRRDFIAEEIVKSIVGAINSINSGKRSRSGYLKASCSNIQRQFKNDIYSQAVEEWGMKGVPTMAALMGKSKRFKSGLNGVSIADIRRAAKNKKAIVKGIRRPSFVDTGILANSIKVWDE